MRNLKKLVVALIVCSTVVLGHAGIVQATEYACAENAYCIEPRSPILDDKKCD